MVKVRVERGGVKVARGDLLLVPVHEGAVKRALGGLDRRTAAAIERRMRAGAFRGRADEVLAHHGDVAVALVGLGTPKEDRTQAWRRAGGRGRQEAERQRAARVTALVGEAAQRPDLLAAFVEGFQLAGYRFVRYQSEPNGRARVQRLALRAEDALERADVRRALARVDAVVPEVFRARDLVNEPPSVATPRFLAEQAEALGRDLPGLRVEVWAPARIAKEGLTGLAGVARGAREEPRFIVLRWEPRGAARRVALVGKAITFDSGGLSLKPPKSMETMKYDMAGGAAVIGAVAAAARLALPVAVTGYVPATENLPGGSAQKPGDVIRFLNGKTVEVLNTDAEGRLVLADGLALAARSKPDALIDLATLTGACRVALGNLYAAVMGTDQALVDALLAAGAAAGEPLWQLPLVAEYGDDLKSPIADLKNVGGEAGSIIGGLFLEKFAGGVPWAHLDIAGPAFTEKELPHAPRGGTGYGVRLLVRYLESIAAARSPEAVG
jgi:leucyl aminopeptidase